MTIAIIVIASVAGVMGVTAGIVSICTCLHTKKILSTQSDQKTTVNVENETLNEEFAPPPPQIQSTLQLTNSPKEERINDTIIEIDEENNSNKDWKKPTSGARANSKPNELGELNPFVAQPKTDSTIIKRTKVTQKINITNVDHKNIFSSEKTHQTGMENGVANTLANVPGTVLSGLTSIVGGVGGGKSDEELIPTITKTISNNQSKKQINSSMPSRLQEISEEAPEEIDSEDNATNNKVKGETPTRKYKDHFESEEDNKHENKFKSFYKEKNKIENKNISKVHSSHKSNHKTHSLPLTLDQQATSQDEDIKVGEVGSRHLSIPTKHKRNSSFSDNVKNQVENIGNDVLKQVSNMISNSPFNTPEFTHINNAHEITHVNKKPNITLNNNEIHPVDLGGAFEESNEDNNEEN